MKKKNILTTAARNQNLLSLSKLDSESLLKTFHTSMQGYDEEAVLEMRERYGENQITHQKADSLFKRLAGSFVNPFTIVLFLLALISLFTDVVLVPSGQQDFTAVILVITMVLISGTLRFVQETRSGKAAQALNAMVKTTTSVVRKVDGVVQRMEIPLNEVVVGDIIYVAAGDFIPADLRLLQTKDLFIGQSTLTGESEPIEKFSGKCSKENPLELDNVAFMGTNIISGWAIGIVLAIGDDSIFGSLAKSITGKKVSTSFEKGVSSVSWLLIRFMLVMAPIVLFINGFTKGDWLQAFLFALSIAVGMTPEMLPMIVTTSLAKGAVNMAKKKTVIKNLNSIQNFGAMDVLCTDKTGTLTQDKVVLEYHLDIHGNTDNRVLRHAFLNSFYQTGLKNLMDIAILNHAADKEMGDLQQLYHKVDEIPFDFNRRRMSVVVADKSGKTQLITKGAVEEMLSICSFVEYQGKVEPLTQEIQSEVLTTVQKLNADGMRVIGIAQKNNPSAAEDFSVADESNMVLMGYLAFLDPPKASTSDALRALKEYGVDVKVLTGDNDAVTRCICLQVGMKVDHLLLGDEVEAMDQAQLLTAVEQTNVFAKLSPQQKARIVTALRQNGHTVGFMGDGINDAPAMRASDVGISVDTAVDIAKESADIILLEKDLMILEQGVVEGRKIFGNMIKYIKMTASSNFGNMFSILAASSFLPFLPMLPVQILILNLIYDTSCISIPWDNMDEDYLKHPKKWDASSIGKFMFWIGPISSIFDILTYLVLFFIICPAVCGGGYHAAGVNQGLFVAVFHAGWFVESLWSQTMIIHMIRTPKIPFLQSSASLPVLLVTAAAVLIGTLISYTILGAELEMAALPPVFFVWMAGILMGYILLVTIVKKLYIKKYGELL